MINKEIIWNKYSKLVLIIFVLLSIFKHWEFIYLRTDETFIGDNVYTKLLTIFAIIAGLLILKIKPSDIGFKNQNVVKNVLTGLALGIGTFAISYGIEILINYLIGNPVELKVYITNFGLNGATNVMKLTIPALIICIIVNLINVFAEEGLFRGLFLKLLTEKYGFKIGNWIQAFLFGIWHIVTVALLVHDGIIGMKMAIVYAVGYVVLAGILALEWGNCVSMSGVLWIGISEHFFNNFIGNFLHVVDQSGNADSLQIARVVLSNFLSLGIVLVMIKKENKKNELVNS